LNFNHIGKAHCAVFNRERTLEIAIPGEKVNGFFTPLSLPADLHTFPLTFAVLEKEFVMMFKIFSELHSAARSKNAFLPCKKAILWTLGLLLLTNFNGCMTAPPLPKANLSEPGWTVREGQAVWKRGSDAPEITGDLVLANRPDGSAFMQFTKAGLPLVIAQTTSAGWQIESPSQNRRYASHGKPPARIVWFQLTDALQGKPVAKGWTWQNSGTNWQLTNSSSGESLEGYLAQ
jgi:hypothetical protein